LIPLARPAVDGFVQRRRMVFKFVNVKFIDREPVRRVPDLPGATRRRFSSVVTLYSTQASID
jgi:hypothetical protein